MNKMFQINESERKRIIGMHEQATKKQYINEVGYYSNWIDVDFGNNTLTLNNYLEMENKEGGDELRLNKGVVFNVKDSKTLIAKNTPFQIVGDYTGSVAENGNADVEYYCSTKEFKIVGRNLSYWGENFAADVQKGFDDLCSQISLQSVGKLAAQNVTAAGVGELAAQNVVKGSEERVGNITKVYCSTKDGVIQSGTWSGQTWQSYKEQYNVTPEEIENLKCNNDYKPNLTVKQKVDLSPRVREVQKKLQVSETGSMDSNTIKAIIDKIKGVSSNEKPEGEVESSFDDTING